MITMPVELTELLIEAAGDHEPLDEACHWRATPA